MAELTNNMNYLMPTGFKVVIDRENYPNLEFFCQSFQHPDMSMAPSEMPFRKVRNIPLPGGTLDFSDITMSIILDEDMKAYTEMHDWMKRLIDQPLTGALDRKAGVAPSTADITLTILNSKNIAKTEIRFQNVYPTSIGALSYDIKASDVDYLQCTASFSYMYYDMVQISTT